MLGNRTQIHFLDPPRTQLLSKASRVRNDGVNRGSALRSMLAVLARYPRLGCSKGTSTHR